MVLLVVSAARAQQVAITFDDLPVHSSLPTGETRLQVAEQILAVIKSEKLPPVYGMVNGVQVEKDPKTFEVLKAWRAAGQPLANHGYTHMNLDKHSVAEFEKDVTDNEKLLEALMKGAPEKGYDWKWLRYPFLAEGDDTPKRAQVRTWLADHGYKVAEVSLEFNDYNWNPPYARCLAKGDDAGVKRLHDTYLAAARQNFMAYREEAKAVFGHEIPYVLLLHIGAFDAHMFPELIAQMKAYGYTFTTLPKAEMDPAYAIGPEGMKGGGPLTDMVARAKGIAIPHRDNYEKELAELCK